MTDLITHPAAIAPAPAVMAILDRFNRDEIGNTIEVLVALLDIWDGDPDHEDDDPAEENGDAEQAAYVEWTTMRGSQKRGQNLLAGEEDDEQDDAPEEDDPSGQCDEDGLNTAYHMIRWTPGARGAGCPIADDDHEYDCREEEDGR